MLDAVLVADRGTDRSGLGRRGEALVLRRSRKWSRRVGAQMLSKLGPRESAAFLL